jgi:hypothetical protein
VLLLPLGQIGVASLFRRFFGVVSLPQSLAIVTLQLLGEAEKPYQSGF